MYFTLKRKLHALHASSCSLVCICLLFVCSKDWNIIFQFKIYLTKLYTWVLYYTQYNILLFSKFELLDCLICLILHVWIWVVVVVQIILLVAFIILSKPQKYLFKNTILNLHMGAKQTYMYFVFYSLSKIISFHYLKVAFKISHICFI